MPLPLFACAGCAAGNTAATGGGGSADAAYVATKLPNVPSTRRSAVANAANSAASGQTSGLSVVDLLATLAHWWQPTDTEATGVSVGSTVATITPYVGTPTITQATAANQATFTDLGLQFNGTTNLYTATSVTLGGSTAFTLLTVANATSMLNYQSIFRFQDASNTYQVFPYGGFDGGTRSILLLLNDQPFAGPSLTAAQCNLGSDNILTAGWQQNSANAYFAASNGVVRQALDSSNASLTNDSLTVGAYKVNQTEFFSGTIKTIAIAKRSYTATERLSLERFFNFYNGLTIFT